LKLSCAIPLLCISGYASAAGLPIIDLNPLLAGYQLPQIMPSANQDGRQSLEINYNLSNISLDQHTASEHVIVDAELQRWQISYSHPLNKAWTLIVDVPYQSISGGSLDSFIEDFHRTFNLPDGNRKGWPRNRLYVDYAENNRTIYHLDSTQAGIGDIAAQVGWHFDTSRSHTTSLWLGLKLPTGDADHLMGSGSVDISATLAAGQTLNDDLHLYEQASMSLLGNGSRLSEQQKHLVWSGALGVSWALTTKLDVVTQLQMHSAAFDSQLKILGTSTQFAIGPRYRLQNWLMALSITEDVVPDSAPDVQFQFDLSHRF